MKKIIIFAALVVFITFNRTEARPDMNVDFNYFYFSLAPHGEWISLDGDLVVWRPNSVNYDWQPYSIGQWSWTQNGWYWDSYEPFGWATYHYGRWMYEDYYGWVWLPDYEWAPAWVEWRYDNDYIGWSPLPAYASFNVGVGIHFSIGWRSHSNFWNFVSYNHFCNRNVHHHFMDHRYVNNFFSRTKYRTNYYYDHDRIVNGGVDRNYIERRGGYRISERQINRINSLDDYNRSRDRNDDGIRSYRPTGKELNRFDGNAERTITRGTKSTSLQKDKVVVGSRRGSEIRQNGNGTTSRTQDNGSNKSREVLRGTEKNPNERNVNKGNDNSRGSAQPKVIKRERGNGQDRDVRSNNTKVESDNNSRSTKRTVKKSPELTIKRDEVKRQSSTPSDKRIEKRKSSNVSRDTKSQSKSQSRNSTKKVERKVRR